MIFFYLHKSLVEHHKLFQDLPKNILEPIHEIIALHKSQLWTLAVLTGYEAYGDTCVPHVKTPHFSNIHENDIQCIDLRYLCFIRWNLYSNSRYYHHKIPETFHTHFF